MLAFPSMLAEAAETRSAVNEPNIPGTILTSVLEVERFVLMVLYCVDSMLVQLP